MSLPVRVQSVTRTTGVHKFKFDDDRIGMDGSDGRHQFDGDWFTMDHESRRARARPTKKSDGETAVRVNHDCDFQVQRRINHFISLPGLTQGLETHGEVPCEP